ncbi:MAG: glycosyltransferase family 4 protein [Anaerolineales bacterium]|nr:glycosyltransferase family 4 protein [Anaerolineales bacterium]
MNLLLILTAYPPSVGGAQIHMHQLAQSLARRHAVQVVTQWDEQRTDWLRGTTLDAPRQAQAYVVDGVPVQRLTLTPEARRRLRPWVWSYFALQGPALRRIAAELQAVMAPHAAAADLIHNCRIGREGLSYASYQLARARGVPFVLTPVHHPRWGGWRHRYYHRLYRQADAVIALTEAERDTLVSLGVAPQRVQVTGIGPVLADAADGDRLRREHGWGADPVVLFLGQKYAYKGLAALLAAAPIVWQRRPETRFVFVGPRTPYSRRLFARVNDARVVEWDRVDVQTKTDALAACTLLCVPSTQESFGGVYTEAWSLGKPVIAADIPAVRQVVSDGVDGLLVQAGAGDLADKLGELLAHPERAAALGAAGRRKVAERYTWERLAALTEAAYARALAGGL